MPCNEVKRPKSRDKIQALFNRIAERQGRRYELVICERLDIAPSAIYRWRQRGVPKDYWPLMAELSGQGVEAIEALHRQAKRPSKFHKFRIPL